MKQSQHLSHKRCGRASKPAGWAPSFLGKCCKVPLFDIGNSIHLQEGHLHGLPWIPCLSQKGPQPHTSSGSMMGRSTSCASSSPPSWPSSIPQSSSSSLWGGGLPPLDLLLGLNAGIIVHSMPKSKPTKHGAGKHEPPWKVGPTTDIGLAFATHALDITPHWGLGDETWKHFVCHWNSSINTVKQRTKGHLMKFIIINQPIHHNCVFG